MFYVVSSSTIFFDVAFSFFFSNNYKLNALLELSISVMDIFKLAVPGRNMYDSQRLDANRLTLGPTLADVVANMWRWPYTFLTIAESYDKTF